jgi:outer membrane protein insertion porin family
MRKHQHILLLIAACVMVSISCNTTKNIPEGDALFTGSKVKVEGPEMSSKRKKELRTELQSLTRPKPNARILGVPFKLWIWNLAGNPKKKNSPAGLLKKFGEAPVLLSDVRIDRNALVLQNNLENTGYFKAVVEGDSTIKNKKASVEYLANTGYQYKIREVVFKSDSSTLDSAIYAVREKSLLKVGEPYDLDIIKLERIRIDALLKEQGFYYFSPEHLIIDVDSTIGNNEVNLYLQTKVATPAIAEKRYTINRVDIYSNYGLNIASTDTSQSAATFYRGYYVYDQSKFYKPKLFEQAMQFSPGEYYNRTEHNLTLNRLINLGIFKFVKNRFEISDTSDSALDVTYYLTPLPKKSLRLELGGNTKSNNLTGSQITLGFTNRNTFRGGEILSINASAGAEVQYSGQFKGYNTYRLAGEANLAFPRFIVPFVTINPRGGFVPRTNIQLGYEILNRQKLYTLNSFRGQYGYIWKESLKKEHTFYPISVQYVKPIKITQLYFDSLAKDATLEKAIDTQFILGANYNYNYNGILNMQVPDGFYFNGLLDVAGNIAGAFKPGDAKNGDVSRILGVPFSQYLKVETDLRFYKRIGKSNVFANRLIVGAGMPYGNSTELPFIKQFFIGGNNSLRAFRSRAVGPGTYQAPGYGTTGFVPDQSGDLKLEINSELRFKIFQPVYGALFVDAGNVWLYNDNPLKPGAKFSNNFLKELAVGSGLGIRVDISILVLRLDVAFPLRKPFLPESERWVIKDIDFGEAAWRKENIIWNLAIGYPF